MLRLNRPTLHHPAASAAVARARLQRAISADRHAVSAGPPCAGAHPATPPAHPCAEDLLSRLLSDPAACDGRRR